MGRGISSLRDRYSQFGIYPAAANGIQTNLGVGSATARTGTLVTASGTSHTVGSYSELIASLNYDCKAITIHIKDVAQNTQINTMLMNLATGAASSEVNFLSNLNVGGMGAATLQHHQGATFWFPGLNIAAGTRISANCQASQASDTAYITLICHTGFTVDAGQEGSWTTYGADTSNSRGTVVPRGVDAYGAWTEIDDTTSDHLLWTIMIGQGSTQMESTTIVTQLGVGPDSGSITQYPGEFSNGTAGAEEGGCTIPPMFVWDLSSGSKIWARQAGGNSSIDTSICLYGLA